MSARSCQVKWARKKIGTHLPLVYPGLSAMEATPPTSIHGEGRQHGPRTHNWPQPKPLWTVKHRNP
eukprot:scaffold55343_cov37-Tisochrysis_lutea.AAC.3